MNNDVERVLRLYGDQCRPLAIDPLVPSGGFSGAKIWRVQTPRGPLGLRRWPAGHPSTERLEFIQAVLWHVDQEGFRTIPVPLETRHRHGYVWFAGHLWELAPWLRGAADYHTAPSPTRLANALAALARFHRAAATFPLPDTAAAPSPGIAERRERLVHLTAGGIDELRAACRGGAWPDLAARGQELLSLAAKAAPKLVPLLDAAATLRVPLQPCIRDIWSAHVLFTGDEVSGIVDFGSMRPENVAADVARLLGSLAGDDLPARRAGLAAYEQVRPLAGDELRLLAAFDRSTVVMGGLQWITWIYLEGREFTDRAAVLARIDEFAARLANFIADPHPA